MTSPDAGTSAPPTKTRQSRQAGIWFALVVIFLDVMGLGLIIPVLPELVRRLVANETQTALWFGVMTSVFALMTFLFAPTFGALADRFGRRPVILVCLTGYGLSYLLLAWAPTIGWLLAGRVISGIMGATPATINAYIADVSTDRDRARNFGMIGAAFGLGFIIAPAVGGLLGSIDLHLPFYAAAGLSLLAAVYGLLVMPESLPVDKRRPFQLREGNPIGGLAVLRRWPLLAGVAIAFAFYQLGQMGLNTLWVLYTSHRYGWGELANGLSLALVGLGTAVVQTSITPRLIALWGERKAITVGITVSCISMVLYGLAWKGWMFAAVVVIGALAGIAFTAVQTFIAAHAPSGHQGAVQGAMSSLISLAAIIGPLMWAGLFGWATSDAAPISVPGLPMFLGAVIIFGALMALRRLFARYPG
ncbi:TCR/Tet family MFS transporter [Aestuariimicrobium ganziense]|uniref:TCR/Tet family MFS transporter n=1 Tax=Aestuariimicrobium ganziense TaxID=2773677 RepID=UPI0019456ECA|nr:TCR/Tet family MFS transporter [Aestuariimicrobium ganziense]